MLFQRLVIDTEVDADRRLRPVRGSTWRSEPARGEAVLHRRLAALAAVPDRQIATFASIYGYLRRRGAAKFGHLGPGSQAETQASGHQLADDAVRLQEWLDRGAPGAPPAGTGLTAATVALLAAVPDPVLDAFERLTRGAATLPVASAAEFYAIAAPIAALAGPATARIYAEPRSILTIDRARLTRAISLAEYLGRVIGGLQEAPEAFGAVGGPDALTRALLVNLPEAYAHPELFDGPEGRITTALRELTQETVAEWRDAARELGRLVRAIDLIRSVPKGGLSAAEKSELAAIYLGLAGYCPPIELPAAELADRAAPLLAHSIEAQLEVLGEWPVRPDALVGLYVRALVAAWIDLTHDAPLTLCASPGCRGAVPPTRNRRYCESCRAVRRRATVRRIRSRRAELSSTVV